MKNDWSLPNFAANWTFSSYPGLTVWLDLIVTTNIGSIVLPCLIGRLSKSDLFPWHFTVVQFLACLVIKCCWNEDSKGCCHRTERSISVICMVYLQDLPSNWERERERERARTRQSPLTRAEFKSIPRNKTWISSLILSSVIIS